MKGLACLCTILVILQVCKGTNDIILSDVQIEDNNAELPVKNHLNDAEPFIPTKEWQIVKPNQAIPAGLHVRMNFQTGIKEAKILEDDDDKGTPDKKEPAGPKITLSEENKNINEFPPNNEKIYFTKEHLKEALSEFRDKVGTEDVNDVMWSNDAKKAMEEEIANAERVKKNFRSIEDIKAELEDTFKMKAKPDVDVMKEITHYIVADNSTVGEIGAALDNLEYYVHQIDNGVDLDKIGGLKPVVHLLNHSNEDIQERAANVIGAATQNNKAVQSAVLNYGGLRLLVQMLHQEKKPLTKKKALFALSAAVRQNNDAQGSLVKMNGIESIIAVVRDDSIATSIHVKAIDLLFDLIEEENERTKKNREKDNVDDRPSLLDVLVKSGLCDVLVPLLNTQDFYTKEKIMHAIRVSADACKETLKQPSNLKLLEKQLSELQQNIKEEDDADFKTYLEGLKDQLEKNVLQKLTK